VRTLGKHSPRGAKQRLQTSLYCLDQKGVDHLFQIQGLASLHAGLDLLRREGLLQPGQDPVLDVKPRVAAQGRMLPDEAQEGRCLVDPALSRSQEGQGACSGHKPGDGS
jgi:hypothetical protein